MRLLLFFLASISAFPAAGDITAIRVLGSVTAVSGTTLSACLTASACTGWVAEVDVDGLSAGGTYALGIGANNSPTVAKLSCTVTGDGYNASAAFQDNTVTRTVYGTHQLRKVYDAGHSAPYPNDETVAAGTLTLRIALSDALYSGETATCNVSAGIYTEAAGDGGTATNAASGVTPTNSSTLTYSQARVIANWSWPGWTRITGTTLTVRAVGFHRHAKNGKPLAAMKFTATDQHSHTATVTVTDMTIDAGMADAVKVQEYVGTLDVSAFTQGDLVTVNFAAYPWVGDSTSAMDTSDAVNAMPTPKYAPQYYIYDPGNTYGSPIAVVDGATGTDANNCAAANTTDPATISPCLTVRGAAVDIRAWNAANASPARADVSGTIYVKAGTYQWTGATTSIAASSGTNPDTNWVTITPYPGVARSAVIFDNTTASGNRAGNSTTKQKISGVTVNFTSGTPAMSGNSYVWFHNCSLTQTVGTALINGAAGGVAYYTHNTVGVGGVVGGLTSQGSVYPALHRGNDIGELKTTVGYFTALGNLRAFPDSGVTAGAWQSNIATVVATAPIFAFNKFTNVKLSSASTVSMLGDTDNPIGGAFIQNVIEYNNSGGAALLDLSGYDSGTTNNIMSWHNTLAGARNFWAYQDVGTTFRLRTLWSEVGSIFEYRGNKGDTVEPGSANRVGNWSALYGVTSYGIVDPATTGFAATGSFRSEFYGLYSKVSPIAASIDLQAAQQPPTASVNQSLAYLGFVNRASFDGTDVGAGNGDYHLTAGSPASNMIPSGMAVLPYDLDGVARKNDGTGAAGAYEYQAAATGRRRVVVIQ